MKINAYIMANRAQEVPIPIPGTEITTGLTKSMGNVSVHFKITYGNTGTYQPMPEVTPTDTTSTFSSPSYVHYYDRTGITGNPLPVDFERHCDYYYEQRPSPATGQDCYIENVSGSVTFGGLQPGKYVAVIEHYYGGRNVSEWSGSDDPAQYLGMTRLITPKTIHATEDGVCYGECSGITEDYKCDVGYSLGDGRVVKFIQKQSFIVADGETGKTITFGGDTFSMAEFGTLLGYNLLPGGQKSLLSYFYSGTVGFRTRVYTDGGNT